MQISSTQSMQFSWIFALIFIAGICLSVGCGGEEKVSDSGEKSSKPISSATEGTASSSPKSADKSKAIAVSSKRPVKESEVAKPKVVEPEIEEPMINNVDFHETLSEAVDTYLTFGLVTPQVTIAPEDCRAPIESDPAPSFSQSDHDASHGKKLYFLFAKDIGHYLTQDGTPSSVGQTLVKESWTSVEANPDARNTRNHASANRINPRAKVGNKTLQIAERKALFVMKKLAVDTPETDEGWVYGVIDPETKDVIAAGKIASCMKCHVDTKNDRLFGPAEVE